MQMRLLKSIMLVFSLAATVQAVFSSEDKFARGLALFNKQSYLEALQFFSEATRNPDREAERLYYCALCYLHTAQAQKAEPLLQQICKDFPSSQAASRSEKYLETSNSRQSRQSGACAQSQKKLPDEPDEISIPFRKTAKGQLTVSAELGGSCLNMLFDTGAEECLFGRNQIEAANLAGVERSRTVILNSVAGPLAVFQIIAPIRLSTLKKILPVCVQDKDMESGILGQPFLAGYSCFVDNQAGLIRLRRSGKTPGAASIDSFAVPFFLDGNKMIVSALLKGRSIDMCFDTGAFGVCLSKKQCEIFGLKLPETSGESTHGPNGKEVPGWQINADLALGPIKKSACPIRVIDAEISYPLLGQNFFGDRTYNIDRDKKEIRFAR